MVQKSFKVVWYSEHCQTKRQRDFLPRTKQQLTVFLNSGDGYYSSVGITRKNYKRVCSELNYEKYLQNYILPYNAKFVVERKLTKRR